MAEPDSDEVLAQFNQLIEELLGGNLHRTTFRPWEIAILVDLARCKPSGIDVAAAADQCPVSREGVPAGGSLRGRAGAAGRGTALETGPREAGPGTAPGRHGRRRPGERDGCPPAFLRAGRASGSRATDHAPAGFGSEVRGSDSFRNRGYLCGPGASGASLAGT